MVLFDIVLVILGLGGLYFGGDWLVRSASRLAVSFGIEPLIIGLTIVAFGTSVPELLVNLSAALQGSTDVALGNVVGSNIANIGLILAITGLIYPVGIQSSLLRREIPIMIIVSIMAVILGSDGEVSATDGVILFVGFIAFNALMYFLTMQARARGERFDSVVDVDVEEDVEADEIDRRRELLGIAAGVVLLALGANFMIEGATNIARLLGVSELVISITLVAFGTSLPELAASVIAALRKESDIAIGNVVGSNIANLLAVLGLTGIVQPIPVLESVIAFQFPAMLVFTVLLMPFAANRILGRREAAFLLVLYALFVVGTFILT